MMTTAQAPRLLARLVASCLIFVAGIAAGRYAPPLEAWSVGPAVPLNVPSPAETDESPQDESRRVLEQLARRLRELHGRETLLQRSLQEDRIAYRILQAQNRCEEEACRRLLERQQRREAELGDVRRQIDELKDLEQRVSRVTDYPDGPPAEGIDPALVAARALLLRSGEAERPVIPDDRWKHPAGK